MTRRLTRLIFLTLLSFSFGAAAMLLFLRPAHADPLVQVTPAGVVLSWQAWLVAGLAAAGGALQILDVTLVVLKRVAPLTKTTLDDRARDKVQVVDTFAHDKLDAILKVVGGLVPASGVPATAAPDAPAGPVLVKPGSGTAALVAVLLVGALAAPALTGCTASQRSAAATTAGHALVNCTAQDIGTVPHLDLATLAAIANVVAEERLRCTPPGAGLDWGCVERDLVGQGVTIGGCALVAMVTAAANAIRPGSGLVAADPAPPPGRVELERFRREVAGGATFHTSSGDL